MWNFFTFKCRATVDSYSAHYTEPSRHAQNGKALDVKPEARTLNRRRLFGPPSSINIDPRGE